jgi:D-3-phosphoglycerate dehydrogenase
VSAHRAFLSREAERSQRRRVAEGVAQVLTEGVPPAHGRVA